MTSTTTRVRIVGAPGVADIVLRCVRDTEIPSRSTSCTATSRLAGPGAITLEAGWGGGRLAKRGGPQQRRLV